MIQVSHELINFGVLNRIIYTTLAVSGYDYSSIQSVETFPSGAAHNDTRCVQITVNDDDALEGDQTFSLILNTVDLVVMILTNTTIITIVDNNGQ